MSLNGPSLTGLRRALAEDRNYSRVRAEASRGFAARSEDYQISAPSGLRSALLAEMADGLTALADNTAENTANNTADNTAEGTAAAALRRQWSWPSPPPAVKPRT